MAHHSRLSYQLVQRLKLAATFLLILVLTGAGTVFALTVEHRLTTHPAVAVEQKKTTTAPTTTKTAAPTTTSSTQKTAPPTTTTTPAPTPAPKPAPVPAPAPAPVANPVVAPSPSGDVPSLQPTATSTSTSTSTTSTSSSSSSTGTSTPTTTQTAVSYKSTNWSGYMASGGTFTAVSGSWVVPSPTSTSTTDNTYDAAWIGIGGVTSSDLIQTGTANEVSPSGTVTTMAFYELLPANAQNIISLTVTPGDTMSASITETGTNVWSLIITDVTTGQSYSKSIAYTSQLSSAEWIEEDPTLSGGNLATLDNFGTVQFSGGHTTMNGSSLSVAASGAASITMVDSANKPIAVPSAVSVGAFSVTYR